MRWGINTYTDEATGIVKPRTVFDTGEVRVKIDWTIDTFRRFWSEGGELLRELDEDGPPNSTDDA